MINTKFKSLYEYNNKIKKLEKRINCQEMEKNRWEEKNKLIEEQKKWEEEKRNFCNFRTFIILFCFIIFFSFLEKKMHYMHIIYLNYYLFKLSFFIINKIFFNYYYE